MFFVRRSLLLQHVSRYDPHRPYLGVLHPLQCKPRQVPAGGDFFVHAIPNACFAAPYSANNIAFVASFSIPTEEDEQFGCTSVLFTEQCDPPQHLIDTMRVLRHGRAPVRPMMLRTECADGTLTLTAIV
jgi:hypothetical protein